MNPTNERSPTFLIDSTYTSGGVVGAYHKLEWHPSSGWVRRELARTHILRFHIPKGIPTIRLILVLEPRPHRDQESQWRVLQPSNRADLEAQSPDITITLFLSKADSYRPKPLPSSLKPSHGDSGESELRIVHDRIYPVNSRTRLVEATFEGSGDYASPTQDELDKNHFRRLLSTFRLLLLHSRAHHRPTPSLPSWLIGEIALEVTRGEVDIFSCARRLTPCMLVCKRWYDGVQDLLWNSPLWIYNWYDYVHILSLVESLEEHPSLSERIHILPRNRRQDSISQEWLALYRRMLTVTSNWTDIHLRRYEYHGLQTQLPHLERVVYLQLQGSDWPWLNTKSDRPLELAECLNTIRGWKELKQLSIRGWTSEEISKLTTQPACYELEELQLSGFDEDRQLSLTTIQHILTKPHSLKSLTIAKVVGLSQADFRIIFSIISSTVETLSISNCNIAVLDEAEVLVLDGIVGVMPCLMEATVEHGLASSLSISRKQMTNGSLSGTFDGCWTPRPNDGIEDLEVALTVTGWKVIKILSVEHKESDFNHAKEIAERRGYGPYFVKK